MSHVGSALPFQFVSFTLTSGVFLVERTEMDGQEIVFINFTLG